MPFLQFPMGPGSDGPMGALSGMDSHHMNGSLGKNIICLFKSCAR